MISILIGFCALPFGSAENTSTINRINDSQPDNLHLISFNAWALPIWIPKSEQIKRFKKIPSQLLETQADIICIQEAFSKRFRKRLLPAIEAEYHTYSDYRCNRGIAGPIVKDCNGGLITLSKYPIVNELFYQYPTFDGMRIEERIGEKGFLLSTLITPKDTIHIINTHLYAGPNSSDERIRLYQIQHMDSILRAIKLPQDQNIYLLGDLNIQHPSVAQRNKLQHSKVYSFITEKMNFNDSIEELNEDLLTIDKSQNKYCGDKNGTQKLDYCMYRTSEYMSDKLIENKTLFKGDQSISDHMAWSVTITENSSVALK